MEDTADKISETFEAERSFYQEITAGLKRLGWSVQYLSGPQKGLYICYGFQRGAYPPPESQVRLTFSAADLAPEYPGIARILRNVNPEGKKENGMEHSVELIVPHKEKTRISITTTCISNIELLGDDVILYDRRSRNTAPNSIRKICT